MQTQSFRGPVAVKKRSMMPENMVRPRNAEIANKISNKKSPHEGKRTPGKIIASS
jgi:hypothetical protein